MYGEKDHKINRILSIYMRLVSGKVLNKDQLALEFKVNNKSIQRDIEQLRFFLANQPDYTGLELKYSRKQRGYILIGSENYHFRREDMLTLIKVLLSTRAFNEKEMNDLINTLLNQVDSSDRKLIRELVGNELFNYVPLRHGRDILDKVWEMSEIIHNRQIIEVSYVREDQRKLHRHLKPVGVMFSDFYFYLIAYMEETKFDVYSCEQLNNDYLRVFRLDRFEDYRVLNRKFYLPYSNRFEEGEFRKRIQFMFLGDLIKLRFEFYGNRIEPILDRLPTATIIEQDFNKFVIEAEVYGKGIVMWLLSQSSNVKVLSPQSLIDEMKDEIRRLSKLYEI